MAKPLQTRPCRKRRESWLIIKQATETLRAPLPTFERNDRVIPIYLFQLLKAVLQERGKDTGQLTKNIGIDSQELDQLDTLVSFDQSLGIIENALELSGDPALGLEIGRRENLSDLGMLGYAIASCKNGFDAVRISASYYQTTTNLTTVEMDQTDGIWSRRSIPIHPVEPRLFRFIVEEDLCGMVKLSRDFSDTDIELQEVHFAYPQPSYVDQYREFFNCPLVFDAEVSQIIAPESCLNFKNKSYNRITEDLALKLCDEMLDHQDAKRSLVNKVHMALLRQPDNFPPVQSVAEELGMSERNLRRALKDLHTSYQDIFNNVRKGIAIRYLQDSSLAMEDIAQLIGFSDSSSFYRSFKQWTGKAPTAYRL